MFGLSGGKLILHFIQGDKHFADDDHFVWDDDVALRDESIWRSLKEL
jgi:hypothetical protein